MKIGSDGFRMHSAMRLLQMSMFFAALIWAALALPGDAHAQSCPPGYYPASAAGDAGGLSTCMPYSRDDEGEPASPSWVTQWGAIAMPPGSFAYGVSYSYGSKSAAKKAAVSQCKKAEPEGRCKVIITYHDQCVALSQGDGGSLAASAGSLRQAEADANRMCGEYYENCAVVYSGCSYPRRVDY